MVAQGGEGWIGYWTHPYRPQDQLTPIVDTEATVWRMSGCTLTEACAADLASYKYDAAEFARLADRLAELGVPVSRRDYDALYERVFLVDPDELFDAGFERLTSH